MKQCNQQLWQGVKSIEGDILVLIARLEEGSIAMNCFEQVKKTSTNVKKQIFPGILY